MAVKRVAGRCESPSPACCSTANPYPFVFGSLVGTRCLSRYYYPEDCIGVECESKREVLESPHTDENELAVVVGSAVVLNQEQFASRAAKNPAWDSAKDNTFFARRFYDPATKLCRPLHGTVQHSKFR